MWRGTNTFSVTSKIILPIFEASICKFWPLEIIINFKHIYFLSYRIPPFELTLPTFPILLLLFFLDTFTAKVQNQKFPQNAQGKNIVILLKKHVAIGLSWNNMGLNRAYVPSMACIANMERPLRVTGGIYGNECVKGETTEVISNVLDFLQHLN